MKTALDAIAVDFAKQNGGKTAKISYASSAVLAKQIEQGAPADIFISADLKWMDYVDKAKLLKAGTRRNLLGNALVLIEPADGKSTLKITQGLSLLRRRSATASSRSAPSPLARPASTARRRSKNSASGKMSSRSSRRLTMFAAH